MSKTTVAAIAAVVALMLCGCASTTHPVPAANGTALAAVAPTDTSASTTPADSTVPAPAVAATSPDAVAAPSTTAAAQDCSLPLTHATDTGFHIAVPSGWDLSSLNGQVLVAQTPADTEAVLVYPALLTKGLTATQLFNTYLAKLNKDSSDAGLPVTIHSSTGADGLPAVNFTQMVHGTELQGRATVAVLPLAAPGATQEAAYISYWSPASEFANASTQLSEIANCFGPEPASAFRIFHDQVFTYELPPGWTTFDESSNSIDLHGPSGTDVSYVFAGPVQTSEFNSPQSLIDWSLHGLGLTSVTSLSSVTSPTQQAANGGTESDEYEQFTGRNGAAAVRGLIFGYAVVSNNGIASGFVRIAVAPTASWNSLNSSMMQIAGSIQHDFTQDLQELQRVNHQWQNFSGQVADFDDTLNNQQLVRDPNTGINYEAPYSAWNANGPRGPGYYLDNGDSLVPVAH